LDDQIFPKLSITNCAALRLVDGNGFGNMEWNGFDRTALLFTVLGAHRNGDPCGVVRIPSLCSGNLAEWEVHHSISRLVSWILGAFRVFINNFHNSANSTIEHSQFHYIINQQHNFGFLRKGIDQRQAYFIPHMTFVSGFVVSGFDGCIHSADICLQT